MLHIWNIAMFQYERLESRLRFWKVAIYFRALNLCHTYSVYQLSEENGGLENTMQLCQFYNKK